MSAHTPGPWTATRERMGFEVWAGEERHSIDTVTVAEISGGFGSTSQADANMIAAVPDLYTALVAYEAFHAAMFAGGRPLSVDGVPIDHTQFNEAHRLASAAIAKAEGR